MVSHLQFVSAFGCLYAGYTGFSIDHKTFFFFIAHGLSIDCKDFL